MMIQKVALGAVLAVSAACLSIASGQAAMAPYVSQNAPIVHRVDCAVGFHIGDAGACIIGTDNRAAPPVVEQRGAAEGCETRSVKRTDAAGNSETQTATNCN